MKEQKLRRVKEAITHCYECFMKDTILNSREHRELLGAKYMAYNILSRLCDSDEEENVLQKAKRINKEAFEQAKEATGFKGEF